MGFTLRSLTSLYNTTLLTTKRDENISILVVGKYNTKLDNSESHFFLPVLLLLLLLLLLLFGLELFSIRLSSVPPTT